jgi:hypothetical protein
MTDITRNYHGGNPESDAAWRSVRGHAGTVRLWVVRYVYRLGARGATCDEIERALDLSHQTASARVTEAKQRGEIVPNGERRRTRSGRHAAVYVDPDTLR